MDRRVFRMAILTIISAFVLVLMIVYATNAKKINELFGWGQAKEVVSEELSEEFSEEIFTGDQIGDDLSGFMLDEDFGTFAGTIAFPLGEKSTIYHTSATLEIYGDGQLIAEFKDIDGTTSPIPFSLPVTGVRELTLVWTSKGADGWKDWGRFAAIFDGRFLVPAPAA